MKLTFSISLIAALFFTAVYSLVKYIKYRKALSEIS